MDIDTGQNMTAFQDFTTNSQISSLSQCNPELVTDINHVHQNSYFLLESQIYFLHPKTHGAGSKFSQKVTSHRPVIGKVK